MLGEAPVTPMYWLVALTWSARPQSLKAWVMWEAPDLMAWRAASRVMLDGVEEAWNDQCTVVRHHEPVRW